MLWKPALLIVVLVVVLAGAGAWYSLRPDPAPEARGPLHLIVSGDTAGWIVPCGCASNQSGGLLRRGSYVKEARRTTELMLADAGGAITGRSEYDRMKLEAILQGELAMGVVAHNLGGPELAFGADYLREVQQRLSAPLVSANARDQRGQRIAPSVRMIRAGGRELALIGVVSPRFATEHVQVTDPREAVLATLQQNSKRPDAVIVLAYLPEEDLQELAASLPEADAVIGGPTGQSLAPRLVGPTLVASSTNKGKFVIHLVAPLDKHERWSGRVVEIQAKLAEDPVQVENLKKFHRELEKRDFSPAETGLAAQLPEGLPEGYAIAGSHACRECHEDDCQLWHESKHAEAWKTLVDRGYHVDPYCQQCHTTGYGLPGGFVSFRNSRERTDVGCESCHGPSLAHQQLSTVRTPFAASDQCISCHDRENSPSFEYASFWEQIQHGE